MNGQYIYLAERELEIEEREEALIDAKEKLAKFEKKLAKSEKKIAERQRELEDIAENNGEKLNFLIDFFLFILVIAIERYCYHCYLQSMHE